MEEIGNEYGRLEVVSYAGRDKHSNDKWLCRCACGEIRTVLGNSLRRGLTKSCGCLRREISSVSAAWVSREYAWKRKKKNTITQEGGIAFIHLPDGSQAMISVEDIKLVKDIRWGGLCGGGGRYVRSTTGDYLHRLIINVLGDSSKQVDHRDGNPLNNRRSNLRIRSQSANMQKSKRAPGKSGYRGVSRTKSGTFQVRLGVRKRVLYLGSFKTAKKAALAYNEAALKYYGGDAALNNV